MLTLLKTLAVLAALSLLIPLCVWGGSGSLRRALEAWKEYGLAMSVIVVPVLLLTVAYWLMPR